MGLTDKISNFFSRNNTGYTQGGRTQKSHSGSKTKGGTINTPFAEKEDEMRTQHKGEFPWLYNPQKGLPREYDPILLRNLVQDGPFVSMLQESIAKEVAKTPWQIVDVENQSETTKRLSKNPFERKSVKQEDEDSITQELTSLIRRPNRDLDNHNLIRQMVLDDLEVGNLSVVKDFNQRAYEETEKGMVLRGTDYKPQNLRILDPVTFTKEVNKNSGLTKGYWQYDLHTRSNSKGSKVKKPIYFDVDEIIWDDFNSRSNRVYGIPPSLTSLDILKLLDLTITQEKHLFSRGMISPGMLVWEELDQEEVKSAKQLIEEDIKGQPDKLMNVGGSGGDVKFENFSYNFKELQFLEREQWYMKLLASNYQVPVSVVGVKPEDVNRSTFEGERGNFESNTLGTYLQRYERILNHQLVWTHFSEKKRFEFVPGMSTSQKKQISDTVRSNYNSGLIKLNEGRKQIGEDEVEEGDQFKHEIEPEPDPMSEMGEQISQSLDEKSKKKVLKDESLRSENWYDFPYQDSDVEDLKEEIGEEVNEVFEQVLSDEEFEQLISTQAEEKSLGSIGSKISQFLKTTGLVSKIMDLVQNKTEEKVINTLEENAEETNLSVDMDRISQRIQDRDMTFANDYANRMEQEIRDVVSEGWSEGKTTTQIKNDLGEKAEEFSDYQAERIARDQLQRATGEARNEFAKQHADKFVEVWMTVGDNRVRDAHSEMDGMWKTPNEEWVVPYENGEQLESFPGDSEKGIQCRCSTKIVPREEVNPQNHRGILNN